MKNIEVKVIRGDYKELEEKLAKLLNEGFRIQKNIVIDKDSFLYAVLTKTKIEETE